MRNDDKIVFRLPTKMKQDFVRMGGNSDVLRFMVQTYIDLGDEL